MGLLDRSLARIDILVEEGVKTLRLGLSVVRVSSSYPTSSSDSGETLFSGSFVSGTTSMAVIASILGGDVVITSSSSSSLSCALPLEDPLFKEFLNEPLKEEKML